MPLEMYQQRTELTVGPTSFQNDGVTQVGMRSSKTGGALMAAEHGPFYEAVSRGRCFMACNQAAVTFGTSLTLTAVTFTLYNPFGSLVNLSILHCGVTFITSSTAGSLVYAGNFSPGAAAPASNTALVVRNAKLSGAAGVGQAFSATTLPAAPAAFRTLASGFTTNANAFCHDPVNGAIVVDPGCCVTVQGITIVGTGLIDMLWEEVPIG